MKISARNQIKGTVKTIREGAVNAVVVICRGNHKIAGISARNQIEGTVVAVKEGAVNGHVTIEDEYGVRVSGSITNEAIEALELAEGKKAVAIVKATDVMVAVD